MMRGQSSAIQRSTSLSLHWRAGFWGFLLVPLLRRFRVFWAWPGGVAVPQGGGVQGGHAGGGPQVIGPAVGEGSLPEQRFEGGQLLVAQARLGAKGGSGRQAIREAGEPPPARQGTGADAQDASDHAGAFSRIHQPDR